MLNRFHTLVAQQKHIDQMDLKPIYTNNLDSAVAAYASALRTLALLAECQHPTVDDDTLERIHEVVVDVYDDSRHALRGIEACLCSELRPVIREFVEAG